MVSDSATSTQVRDELESLLVRDLLGPWDGPEEELPPGVPPSERYLLGRLVPRTPQAAPRAAKVQGCWRTLATLQRHCRIRSHLVSARNHRHRPNDAIRDALSATPWRPVQAA